MPPGDQGGPTLQEPRPLPLLRLLATGSLAGALSSLSRAVSLVTERTPTSHKTLVAMLCDLWRVALKYLLLFGISLRHRFLKVRCLEFPPIVNPSLNLCFPLWAVIHLQVVAQMSVPPYG